MVQVIRVDVTTTWVAAMPETVTVAPDSNPDPVMVRVAPVSPKYTQAGVIKVSVGVPFVTVNCCDELVPPSEPLGIEGAVVTVTA